MGDFRQSKLNGRTEIACHFFGKFSLMQKHRHVDRRVEFPAVGLQRIIVKDNRSEEGVLGVGQQVVERSVTRIVLAAFHLNGKNGSRILDDKINFAALLGIVIVRCETMCLQLLCNNILVHGPEVDFLLAVHDPELNSVHYK